MSDLSRVERFFDLIRLLMNKFEQKQLESYELKSFLTEIPTGTGWKENERTGWEEVRILFKPKK